MRRALFAILIALLSACGSSGSGGDGSLRFDGTVVDERGQPLPDVQAFIFETNESSISDDQGTFSLESFKHLGAVNFFFKRGDFSNKVGVASIPGDAAVVTANFMLSSATNEATLLDVAFDSDPNAPVGTPPTVTPLPSPGKPGGEPTARPGRTPTPTPRRSPTPVPGNFDSNGNTSAFGIPSGVRGNISAGAGSWGSLCRSCHATEKTNRSYGQIRNSFRTVPSMRGLSVSVQQTANLTAYLNRGRR